MDQALRNWHLGLEPHNLSNRCNRRITWHSWLNRENLAHDQASPRRATHQISEGASAINPELPAHQLRAAPSAQIQTCGCRCSQLAGKSTLGGSFRSLCKTAALATPVTTK